MLEAFNKIVKAALSRSLLASAAKSFKLSSPGLNLAGLWLLNKYCLPTAPAGHPDRDLFATFGEMQMYKSNILCTEQLACGRPEAMDTT
jgi:hypothetical protein